MAKELTKDFSRENEIQASLAAFEISAHNDEKVPFNNSTKDFDPSIYDNQSSMNFSLYNEELKKDFVRK